MVEIAHIWFFPLTHSVSDSIFASMISDIQKKTLSALFVFLRPLIKALLRSGIGYAEFSEVAKACYVQVCLDEFGFRGRKTNVSRVAVMTGISRKELNRIKLNQSKDSVYQCDVRNPISEILHIWFTDPDYLDERGYPKPIPYRGNSPSFSELHRRIRCDVPPGAVKTELARMGVISVIQQTIVVNRREFVPDSVDERLVEGLLAGLKSHADTIAFNADPANPDMTRYECLVECLRVDARLLPKLRRVSRKRLYNFASSFDDYLAEYSVEDDEDVGTNRAGIGVFYFEDTE